MPRVYQPTEQLPVHRLTEEGIVLWKGDTRWVEPVHTHNFIELVYTYSGHITHEINAEPFRATRGDLFFINFNYYYTLVFVKRNNSFYPKQFTILSIILGNIPPKNTAEIFKFLKECYT